MKAKNTQSKIKCLFNWKAELNIKKNKNYELPRISKK